MESPIRPASRPFSILRREGPWRDAFRRRLIALADIAAALAAATAVMIVDGVQPGAWVAACAPLWVGVAKCQGLYDADHVRIRHLTSEELARLFYWATVSVAASVLLLNLTNATSVSDVGAAGMWGVAFVGVFCGRIAARALWRRLVRRETAVVLGGGHLADALMRKLTLESGHHLEVVKWVVPGLNQRTLADSENELRSDRAGEAGMRAERLDVAELTRALSVEGIERVVIAVGDLDEELLAEVLPVCRRYGVKLSVAPPIRAALGTAVCLNHLAELPLIEYRTWDPSRTTMTLKRATDVVVAALALVVAMPIMLVIALAIALDSNGPTLFSQRRAGLGGKPFRMWKFRTMVRDAETRLDEVIDPAALEEPMFKIHDDPRVTRVGRLLRRTSLDELPQLWNVLRGDMSLVGPRPEECWLVERYGPDQTFRLSVRPGLTGPMQVHGRAELTFQERIAVEREYVENYSFEKDVRIMLRTAAVVLRKQGAY